MSLRPPMGKVREALFSTLVSLASSGAATGQAHGRSAGRSRAGACRAAPVRFRGPVAGRAPWPRATPRPAASRKNTRRARDALYARASGAIPRLDLTLTPPYEEIDYDELMASAARRPAERGLRGTSSARRRGSHSQDKLVGVRNRGTAARPGVLRVRRRRARGSGAPEGSSNLATVTRCHLGHSHSSCRVDGVSSQALPARRTSTARGTSSPRAAAAACPRP